MTTAGGAAARSIAGVVAALLVLAPPGLAHPDSLSGTLLEVRGDEVHVRLRCQVLSLLEVIPDLDADGDGEVDGPEVAAKRVEILAYLMEHYVLFTGSDRDLTGGVPLAPAPLDVAHLGPGAEEARGYRAGAVDATFVFRAPELVRDLLVHSTLFVDTSPDHIDYATIVWSDELTVGLALDRDMPRGRSDPTGRGAFTAFLRAGFVGLRDHWVLPAFALALGLASRGRRGRWVAGVLGVLAVVGGVLAGDALGLQARSSQAGLVRAAAALSVAYLGVRGLEGGRRQAPAIEAALFGFAHGLALQLAFGALLVREPVASTAAAGLLLGAAGPAVLIGLLAGLGARPTAAGAAPPVWLRTGSAALVLVGLWAFIERL